MRFWVGDIFSDLVTIWFIVVKGKHFVGLWITFLRKSWQETSTTKKLMFGVWVFYAMSYVQVWLHVIEGKAPFESKTDENETYDKILKVDIQFPLYMSPQVVDFIGRILNRDPQKRINLEEIETHEWMRTYENESGRMISKEIWDSWMKLTKWSLYIYIKFILFYLGSKTMAGL